MKHLGPLGHGAPDGGPGLRTSRAAWAPCGPLSGVDGSWLFVGSSWAARYRMTARRADLARLVTDGHGPSSTVRACLARACARRAIHAVDVRTWTITDSDE